METERTIEATLGAADALVDAVRELLRALPADFPDVDDAIAEYEWQRHGIPKPDDDEDEDDYDPHWDDPNG